MRISVLMENTPHAEGFYAEHGLSLHIETDRHRILFDMGQTDGFLANAAKLNVDIAAVDVAVLSHGHYDHGGGLMAFLRVNANAPVYLSRYAFDKCYSGADHYIGLAPELAGSPRLRYVGETLAIDDTLTLAACNRRKRPFVTDAYGLTAVRHGVAAPDTFRHEQYLLLSDHGRRVLISGCSHKGILNIARWFQPDVLIGGFHFMKVNPNGAGREVLGQAAQVLLQTGARYYTCHCTGLAQFDYLKARMGDALQPLTSGQQLTL